MVPTRERGEDEKITSCFVLYILWDIFFSIDGTSFCCLSRRRMLASQRCMSLSGATIGSKDGHLKAKPTGCDRRVHDQ